MNQPRPYTTLYRALRQRLEKGEWPWGTALPSLRRLAADYRVGLQVVRHAMQQLREENYIYRSGGRRYLANSRNFLCSATSNLVAIVMAHGLDQHWANSEWEAMQRGVQSGLGKSGIPVLLVHHSRLTRSRIPPGLLDVPLSAILLCGNFMPAALAAYRRLDCPVVIADQPAAASGLPYIAVENRLASYDATLRLIRLGHQRIAFLRFVQLATRRIDPDSLERYEGFKSALIEAGLPCGPGSVFNTVSNDVATRPVYSSILKARPAFTAVVSSDGFQAVNLRQSAANHGLSVPADLSIVSFQAQEHPRGDFSGPRVAFFEMGQRAAQMLLTRRKDLVAERMPTVWHDGCTLAPPPRRP